MRESIGGTMIFWIVLFLFSIFITFSAFIIKYARVYKMKNTIINYIIKKNGVITHNKIDDQLKEMGYQEDGSYKICRFFPTKLGEYYYVELYSVTGLPIIGSWLSMRATIKGETRNIKLDDKNTNIVDQEGAGDWFYGTEDQCYLCVFENGVGAGSKCKKTTVE